MSNLFNETITQLQIVFTTTDNLKRKQAESILKTMEVQIISHISHILDGIKQCLIKDNIKLSVIVYLKTTIRSYLSSKTLHENQLIEIVRLYMDMLLNEENLKSFILSENCIVNMLQTIKFILDSSEFIYNNHIALEILILITNSINSYLNFNNIRGLKLAVELIESMISSNIYNKNNCNECYEILQPSFIKIITFISESLSNFIIELSNLLSNNVAIDASFFNYITLTESFFSLLRIVTIKYRSRLTALDSIMHYLIQFFPYAIKFLSLNSNTTNNSLLLINLTVVFTSNSQLNKKLNSSRIKAFQFINGLLLNNDDFYLNEYITNNSSTLLSLISKIISDLSLVIENNSNYLLNMTKDGLEEFTDENHSSVIYESLVLLSKLVSNDTYIPLLYGDIKNIISKILFPLLFTNKEERELIELNGEEYFNLSSDIIDNHSSKTIKSISALIIKKITEYYDGMLGFIIQISMETIIISHFLIGDNYIMYMNMFNTNDKINLENLLYKHISYITEKDGLILNIESSIFKHFPLLYLQEQSLTALCTTGSKIIKNKYYILLIKNFLDKCLDILLSSNNSMILDKVCLFFSVYAEILYDFNSQSMTNIISILFNCVFSKAQGLVQTASFALNEIFTRTNLDSQSDIIYKNLSVFINNIKNTESCLLLDVFYQLVLRISIDDYSLFALEVCTNRVVEEVNNKLKIRFKITKMNNENTTEYQVDDSNKENATYIINKFLNIIRLLITNDVFIESNYFKIEEILSPLCKFMCMVSKISFDEDILDIGFQILKRYKKFTYIHSLIYPYCLNYIKKNKGITFDLFIYLNQCIIHGNDDLFTNEEYMMSLIDIVKFALSNDSETELSDFLGVNLLTILVMQVSNLPNMYVNNILLLCSEAIRKEYDNMMFINNNNTKPENPFLFLSLLSVIISAFNNYSNTIMKFIDYYHTLINLQLIVNYIEIILMNENVYNNYLFKIILIGISKIMIVDTIVTQSTEILFILLKCAIVMLQKQKNHEIALLKSKLSHKMNIKQHKESDLDNENENEKEEEDEDDEDWDNTEEDLYLFKYSVKAFQNKKNTNNDEEIIDINTDMNFQSEITGVKDFVSQFDCKYKCFDEYSFFKKNINILNDKYPQVITNFYQLIQENERKTFEMLIKTTRVKLIGKDGEKLDELPRKIVKIKRNLN